MLTVIIPAQNETLYLNRTIENIIRTAFVRPEIIVVDNGGNGSIDSRAEVINPGKNVGERVAMNLAAKAARNEFLFRIDAHCDASPNGWDTMLAEVTGEKDLTMAVLTAIRKPWDQVQQGEQQAWLAGKRTGEDWENRYGSVWKEVPKPERKAWVAQNRTREDWVDWQRQKGHWYGMTKLWKSAPCPVCHVVTPMEDGRFVEHKATSALCLGSGQAVTPEAQIGLEAKWHGANKDHANLHGVMPTMGATGCGMFLRKSWYEEIGGADEMLPPMGAIGEEFALKTWLAGGRCQLHCDVQIGHVWGTGGYPTGPVFDAQRALYQQFGDRYDEIAGRPEFAGWIKGAPIKTAQPGKPIRTVDVIRTDTHDSRDGAGKLIRRRIERFRYLWLSDEHPGEESLTDKQIEEKYAPQGVKIGQDIVYFDEAGQPVTAAPLVVTP